MSSLLLGDSRLPSLLDEALARLAGEAFLVGGAPPLKARQSLILALLLP